MQVDAALVDAASRSVWAARDLKKSSPRLPHLLAACMWNLQSTCCQWCSRQQVPHRFWGNCTCHATRTSSQQTLGGWYEKRWTRPRGGEDWAGGGGEEGASPGHPVPPRTGLQRSRPAAKPPGWRP